MTFILRVKKCINPLKILHETGRWRQKRSNLNWVKELQEETFKLAAQAQKEAQEQVVRSEQLETVGNFVQAVAHEIRNPITTIGGFARRIKKTVEGDQKLQRYINIILEESERLETLVKRVREFANLLSPEFELYDIRLVLDEVKKVFETPAKKQGVGFVTEIDEKFPLIKMDSFQLVTALSNIMENALESMPHGGKLMLEAKQEHDNILIRILDTGWGIAEEHLNSVYDPFFTSKTSGVGLGSTMVNQIVMNHDGKIDIQSQEGVGTTVALFLPVRE
jgi:signal transduction histidine kinase